MCTYNLFELGIFFAQILCCELQISHGIRKIVTEIKVHQTICLYII